VITVKQRVIKHDVKANVLPILSLSVSKHKLTMFSTFNSVYYYRN